MYFIIVVFQDECPTAADNNSVNEFENSVNVGAPFTETGEGTSFLDTPQLQVQLNFPHQSMWLSKFDQGSPARKDDKVYHDSSAVPGPPVGGLPEYLTGAHADSHPP